MIIFFLLFLSSNVLAVLNQLATLDPKTHEMDESDSILSASEIIKGNGADSILYGSVVTFSISSQTDCTLLHLRQVQSPKTPTTRTTSAQTKSLCTKAFTGTLGP